VTAIGIGANRTAEVKDGRADELDASREKRVPSDPGGDCDDPVFERLPERLEDRAWKLR